MKIIEEKYAWARTNFTTQKPDTIVIHHALSPKCTAQDIHRWHLDRGWMGIAYHYFVRKDGSVYRGRQETHKGGHLLGDENNNTLGICLEGCYTDYGSLTEKTVPETQIQALIELCNDIKKRWTIKAIKRHADYVSAQKEGKDCPGKYFPWVVFLRRTGGGNMAAVVVNDTWKDKAVDFVVKFQQATGLTVDGKAGNDTNAKLNAVLTEIENLKKRLDEIRVKATL
jgi:N-acetyl-anhydromuramyl-L-alanine amidase AmpD